MGRAVCELLLECGAQANELDKWGASALHHAASRGRLEIVQMLIAANGDVNAMNQTGQMPLDLAKKSGHRRVVDVLVAEAMRRADIRKRENRKTCSVCTSGLSVFFLVLFGTLYVSG